VKILRFAIAVTILTQTTPLGAQRPARAEKPKPQYISFVEAQPVVSALGEILPDQLKGKSESDIAAAWPAWIARYDAQIRSRLAQGDEDSVINFLLFGTAFTKQPRVTLAQLQQLNQETSEPFQGVIRLRITDLVEGATAPRANDRLVFVRRVLTGKGFRLETANGKAAAEQFLAASLRRVMSENSGYARTLEAARLQGDTSEEFAERSRLFRNRGLSSDTSLLPNFAIEQSLADLKSRNLLSPISVRRVAIIGPGLDFTDKQEGYDFYPLQTVQPFAIIDSLLRLGLAKATDLQVTTFDLSDRVNGHLAQARARAQRGQPYIVQVPRDEAAQWKPESIRYWQHFGDQIGSSVAPVTIPIATAGLRSRAVRIPPSVVLKISPVDTNIVLQRLELPPPDRFDLIIATNILVYYDNFDQSLAMLNIEKMLKPGGFLLSNNALLELPFFKVHSVGYSTVVYSDRPNDGDHIVWYRLSE
jgi:SAM-dependent methyltransferase